MARGQPQGEEVYRPEVSALDLPRKMVPEIRGIAPVGAAISDIGNSITQKYQADSAAYAGDQMAAFRLSELQNLKDAKEQAPAGDPGDFAGNYMKGFSDRAQKLADNVQSNPYASAIIHKGLQEFSDALTQHTMDWEGQQRVAYRTDSVINNTRSQAAVVEAHPELASSVGSTLMDQINTVGGDPARRLALARQMNEQISLAAANGLARQNPRAVAEGLKDPDNAPDALKNLNDQQREQVMDRAMKHLSDPVFAALSQGDTRTAQRMLNQNADVMDSKTFESVQRGILATDEHNLVMQEKYQKVASDNLSKEGDSLLAQGKLTPQWIEDHKKTLEANEFRYFYKALSGTEESATNPRTFADLYLRAANGEDVREEARKALTDDHDLSRQDFTKITGLVDQTHPGWYKRGAQFIADTLKTSELEKDPAGNQSKAYALRDWDDWAAQNPQATLEQAHKAQDEIAGHYRIVPDNQIALMSRAPMFLVGTRTNPVDENGKPDPNLNATVRRYQEAVKSGQITGPAAQAEAVRIQNLRQIIQKQQAAQAAAKAKKVAE